RQDNWLRETHVHYNGVRADAPLQCLGSVRWNSLPQRRAKVCYSAPEEEEEEEEEGEKQGRREESRGKEAGHKQTGQATHFAEDASPETMSNCCAHVRHGRCLQPTSLQLRWTDLPLRKLQTWKATGRRSRLGNGDGRRRQGEERRTVACGLNNPRM
ncbi:unnamed protein product, partial [Prorocentrum cordatum]